MSTNTHTPTAKTKPALSLLAGGAPSPEEGAFVLLRVRDIGRLADRPPAAEPPAEEPLIANSQAVEAVADAKPVAAIEPAAQSEATETQPAAETAAPTEPALASPSRRQRQRRETKPQKRDWFHSFWQGTVGLLLVAMFVIVYFMMTGGMKRGGASASAEKTLQPNEPAPESLTSPEISIPDAMPSVAEMKKPASQNDNVPAEAKEPEVSEFVAEPVSKRGEPKEFEQPERRQPFVRPTERAEERSTQNFEIESGKRVQNQFAEREAAEPSRPEVTSSVYPVTTAQATYPVTSPDKFRYPDDTRPSGRPSVGQAGGNIGPCDIGTEYTNAPNRALPVDTRRGITTGRYETPGNSTKSR